MKPGQKQWTNATLPNDTNQTKADLRHIKNKSSKRHLISAADAFPELGQSPNSANSSTLMATLQLFFSFSHFTFPFRGNPASQAILDLLPFYCFSLGHQCRRNMNGRHARYAFLWENTSLNKSFGRGASSKSS